MASQIRTTNTFIASEAHLRHGDAHAVLLREAVALHVAERAALAAEAGALLAVDRAGDNEIPERPRPRALFVVG